MAFFVVYNGLSYLRCQMLLHFRIIAIAALCLGCTQILLYCCQSPALVAVGIVAVVINLCTI